MSWDRFTNSFLEEYLRANPEMGVSLGRHEFDGRLSDWSEDGLGREIDRLRASRLEVLKFADDQLDARQRLEKQSLLIKIDGDLFWRETADWPHRNPMFYLRTLNPSSYLLADYAPPNERLERYIEFVEQLPRACDQIRQNLRKRLPRIYSSLAANAFDGLATYVEGGIGEFVCVENRRLQNLAKKRVCDAARCLRELSTWFSSQNEREANDFALGQDLLIEMLRATEGIDANLEDLDILGRGDLERNIHELHEACAALDPSSSVEACVERVLSEKPSDGAVDAARKQIESLRSFIRQVDLVTIPDEERPEVATAPPHLRWNFAFIDIPGPFEYGQKSVYYIAPPDSSWSPVEQRRYLPSWSSLMFTSAHEVYPGHFLHNLHARRSRSKVSQTFWSYLFTEGWAHYTEELVCEAGFGDDDPKLRIGQVINALRRNVRFVSAVGLHSGSLSIEDSQALFQRFSFSSFEMSKQQAVRGAFDPAYMNYTLGKLLIRRLREEWTQGRGGRDAWRAFHDRVLSYVAPPVPLLRQAMLAEPVAVPLPT